MLTSPVAPVVSDVVVCAKSPAAPATNTTNAIIVRGFLMIGFNILQDIPAHRQESATHIVRHFQLPSYFALTPIPVFVRTVWGVAGLATIVLGRHCLPGELRVIARDHDCNLAADVFVREMLDELAQHTAVGLLELLRELHADSSTPVAEDLQRRGEEPLDPERRLVVDERVGELLVHCKEALPEARLSGRKSLEGEAGCGQPG